jgi:hypothetical protein
VVAFSIDGAAEQIVGRERNHGACHRQLTRYVVACRRVNSDVGRLLNPLMGSDLIIHNWIIRLVISLFVFLVVSGIVVPHLMDVNPPRIVNLLLWPMDVLGPQIGKILPHGNIGTPEHPVYEGTPLDFLAGFALAFFSILLYPIATYLGLALFSRIVRHRKTHGNLA